MLELFVGQVKHVGGLLQFAGARGHAFFQGGVELLELIVLLLDQLLQAPTFTLRVLMRQGLAQGQEQFFVVHGGPQLGMVQRRLKGFGGVDGNARGRADALLEGLLGLLMLHTRFALAV